MVFSNDHPADEPKPSFRALHSALLPCFELGCHHRIERKRTDGAANEPISVFVQGEIANYPRPSADRTPLPVWQSNAQTRWPDGSVQQALVSFPLDPGLRTRPRPSTSSKTPTPAR